MSAMKARLFSLFAVLALLLPASAQDLAPGAFDRAVQTAWPNVSPELAGRIRQDETMAACSAARNQPDSATAAAIQAREAATIRFPADGALMGDWRRGEQGALSGYGLRMGDVASRPNGGNCYACHQLTATELSFGTLGPSLLGYGKSQGNTPETQRRVWEKLYNPHAAFPCSSMPRFGANGVLTLEQMKDFVALLLDPASPVNR